MEKNNLPEAHDMAQQLKVPAAKTDKLSSMAVTHEIEEGNWLLQVILWPPQHSTGMHTLRPQNTDG